MISPPALRADLDFPVSALSLHPVAGTNQIAAVYAFTNRGKSPVKILEISPSCGCLEIEPLKNQEIAPGTQGEIRSSVILSGLRGTKKESILIRTNHPQQPMIQLTMTIEAASTLDLNPKLLTWNSNEPLKAKTLKANVPEGKSYKIKSVRSSSALFTATMETSDSGKHVTIRVLPINSKTTIRSQVLIETDDSKVVTVPVEVKP